MVVGADELRKTRRFIQMIPEADTQGNLLDPVGDFPAVRQIGNGVHPVHQESRDRTVTEILQEGFQRAIVSLAL